MLIHIFLILNPSFINNTIRKKIELDFLMYVYIMASRLRIQIFTQLPKFIGSQSTVTYHDL